MPYSPASSRDGRLSKYSILAQLYFFFNSVLLPKGLLYTTILSPLFFYNTLRQKRKTYLQYFSVFLLIFDCVHLAGGVDLRSFFISNIVFTLIYFTAISFYHFFSNYADLGKLFRQIVALNTVLILIAIPFFFLPKQYREYFWYLNQLTTGFSDFPRLALFTYEASYYALLMIPVFYYYIFKFFFFRSDPQRWTMLALAALPMLLSLSFGVLGATALTVLIMAIAFSRRLFKYRTPFILVASSLLLLITGLSVLAFFPENALYIRLANILGGRDTSANGRIFDSFGLAWHIVSLRSTWFGAGLGQIKFMAIAVVNHYYHHWGNFPRFDIPNAMAETLAIFGVLGAALRLGVEILLFFRTKVYSNYYRLALFIFVFIYQFTGSFITNVAEYVIWVLAFSNVFDQFRIPPLKKHV